MGSVQKERLDVLVVNRGLVPTRQQARARILAGHVVVDDHRVDKPGTRVSVDAALRLKGAGLRWVSRGGLKLEHALVTFALDVTGVVALDVGASTGGFTHVLLEGGAALVHAVDVGSAQMVQQLRTNPRVHLMERTHIKNVPALVPTPVFGCVDVSFISLRQVLPYVAALMPQGGELVALVKPQFEAGRALVGKGGVVRDPEVHRQTVALVQEAATALGLVPRAVVPSPITGQEGNVEFLLWLTHPGAGRASPALNGG